MAIGTLRHHRTTAARMQAEVEALAAARGSDSDVDGSDMTAKCREMAREKADPILS